MGRLGKMEMWDVEDGGDGDGSEAVESAGGCGVGGNAFFGDGQIRMVPGESGWVGGPGGLWCGCGRVGVDVVIVGPEDPARDSFEHIVAHVFVRVAWRTSVAGFHDMDKCHNQILMVVFVVQ